MVLEVDSALLILGSLIDLQVRFELPDAERCAEGTRPDHRFPIRAQAPRRRLNAKYKERILDEVAACKLPGEVGALLRREALYAAHLTKWRQRAEQGRLAGLEPRKRGPVPQVVDPRDKRLAEVERELTKMTRRAERAEALVALQKKVSEWLGIVLPRPEET